MSLSICRPGTALSPGHRCLIQTSIRIPQEMCLSVSPLCVNAAVLLCVCVACPLSRSPWRRGGHVAQILLSEWHVKLRNVLLDPSFTCVLHFCHRNCIYYVFLLLICAVHTAPIACLCVLEEGSLLCCSFWGFFHFFFLFKGFGGEFFLIQNQGSKDRRWNMLYRL